MKLEIGNIDLAKQSSREFGFEVEFFDGFERPWNNLLSIRACSRNNEEQD
jgi:hypothetical protein